MDNENIKGADDMARRLDEAIAYFEQDAPLVIGTEAVNNFKEGFENEGFKDSSLKKWAPRKTLRQGGTNSQKVLSKSGELADSITFRIQGGTVVIYSDKSYAKIHNEGGKIAVTPTMKKYFWAQFYQAKEGGDDSLMQQYKALALAKEINIEQRKFMGESEALMDRIIDKILRDLQRILIQ